jgi:hypothetical protein
MDDIYSLTLAVNIFDTAFYHTAFVWVADQVELESLTGSKNATPAFAGLMTGGLFKWSSFGSCDRCVTLRLHTTWRDS